MNDRPRFLALVYKMDAEPSTNRVAVWRKLKAMGAVYLQNSACLLPDTPETERRLASVRRKIVDFGGWSIILRAQGLDSLDDQRILGEFNCARGTEYAELVDRCHKFLSEIDEETARGNFSYAEIEENEDDLKKLRRWFTKIRARDFFNCPAQEEASILLARCEQILGEFASRVYAEELGEGMKGDDES